MRPRRPRTALAIALALLAAAPGCSEPRNPGNAAAPKPAPPPEDTFIVGKTTQDIQKLTPEERAKGQVATGKITAKDPITLSGNAYVSVIGQASVLQIQHSVDLFKALNDRYPKDIDEFMSEIVKPNGIALPRLPYYQKYFYDEAGHKLVIMEYPELKDQPAR